LDEKEQTWKRESQERRKRNRGIKRRNKDDKTCKEIILIKRNAYFHERFFVCDTTLKSVTHLDAGTKQKQIQ
jgi:hypothetical protein